jgi:hypothetical protein
MMAGGDDSGNLLATKKEAKVEQPKVIAAEAPKESKGGNVDENAILVTGATHARELLSMQVPMFLALKLLHQGVSQDKEKYQ